MYTLLFVLISSGVCAQHGGLFPKIDRELLRHRSWIDLSNGPSFTDQDIFAAGPGLSVGWITKSDHLIKIKTSYHEGLGLFTNFPQRTGEVNLMAGVIYPLRTSNLEFYYGVSVIGGERWGKELGSSAFGFGLDLTTDYERIKFITGGIPLELRVQWKVFGLGADANLNLDMPYFGIKLFTRIGVAKLRRNNPK